MLTRGERSMKIEGTALSHDLAHGRRASDRGDRPDVAAASFLDAPDRRSGDGGRRDKDHGRARRAVDRRDRRLRPRARAGRGGRRRRAGARLSRACWRAGRPPSTCATRSTKSARVVAAAAARASAPRAAWARAGEICEEDVALNRGIGEAGLRTDRGGLSSALAARSTC